MEEYGWKDSMSMDIEELDEQHRHAFDLLSGLREAMRLRMDRRVVIKRMGMLLDYMSVHFAVEERLMHEYGYPRLVEHKRQHGEFAGMMNLFCERLKNERAIITFETINEMSAKMSDHIERFDRRYIPFVQHEDGRKLPPPVLNLTPPSQPGA